MPCSILLQLLLHRAKLPPTLAPPLVFPCSGHMYARSRDTTPTPIMRNSCIHSILGTIMHYSVASMLRMLSSHKTKHRHPSLLLINSSMHVSCLVFAVVTRTSSHQSTARKGFRGRRDVLPLGLVCRNRRSRHHSPSDGSMDEGRVEWPKIDFSS